MAHLLDLSGGGVSLEMDEAELPRVRQVILEEFGRAKVSRFADPDLVVYVVDGEELAFWNAWADPCLISDTERGCEILRRIFDKIGT